MTGGFRCVWCRRSNVHPSGYEQRLPDVDEWVVLCKRCATKRLSEPYNASRPIRRRDSEASR